MVGATSAIVHETAKLFAANKTKLFLVGRTEARLNAVKDDLQVRGAEQISTMVLDLTNLDRHQELVDAAVDALGGLDAVLIGHGTLGNQESSEQDVSETMQELTTNCTSVISLLTIMANYFEKQKHGCIAVISSVAGDRGRKSNYVYGTAKGAVHIFLQGLRNRLFESGIQVVTIKPGFVDTPMTASMPKNFLFAKPETVGKGIYNAMTKGKDVVYLPGFWRLIMMVIKGIPEFLFKRLSL